MLLPFFSWMRRTFSDGLVSLTAEVFFLLVALVIAALFPKLGEKFFANVEAAAEKVSLRRALILAFLVPLAFRIATIPLYPPPQPKIHDEFSFLLMADTLREGRIANPTHPMWRHFETMHVIHEPSYASKYPILQGVVLAFPQYFGLPAYVGVWISNGVMSAAIYWMLRAFLTPGWALISVLIVFLRVGTFSAWMHSYWGGAASAAGGALAIGALMRLFNPAPIRTGTDVAAALKGEQGKNPDIRVQRARSDVRELSKREKTASSGTIQGGTVEARVPFLGSHLRKYSILMGVGIGILANSRPYEGATLSAVLGITLSVWLLRQKDMTFGKKLREVVIPLGVTVGLALCFIAYQNWRITGTPLKLPYMRNRELYGTPQTFYYQPPAPPVLSPFKEINDNYEWQRMMHDRGATPDKLWFATKEKAQEFWQFYLGVLASIPFLALPWILRRRELRMPLAAIGLVLLAVGVYPFFYPHYLGPIAGLLLLLTVSGILVIREWTPFGRPFGLAFSRWLLVGFLGSVVFNLLMDLSMRNTTRQYRTPRTQVVEALEKMGDSHVIFVRYAPNHEFHWEIVYNAANIDAAPIVWARDMGSLRNLELIQCYKHRKAWIFEPDAHPPRLTPVDKVPFIR